MATVPTNSAVVTQPTLRIYNQPAGTDIAPGSNLSGTYNYSGSSSPSAGTIITPASLTQSSPVVLPLQPAPVNYNGAMTGGNTALGITNPAINPSNNANGAANPMPPIVTTGNTKVDTVLGDNRNLFDQYINNLPPPPKLADQYQQDYANAGIAQKQQVVNDLTAQINAITAGAAADKLSLVGQGRGIPEAIIGGQQAQIDREAAIRAIPLQASLAAAQGNLKFAQDQLDTLFNLKSKDIENDYTYKTDLVKSVYNFATEQQKTKLDAITTADNRDFEQKNANLALINSWSQKVVSTGQSQLIADFGKLDPSSKTFTSDLAAITSQVKDPTIGLDLRLKQAQIDAANRKTTTVDERKSSAISQFSSAFVPGARLKDGTPVLDSNGLITPVAWKQAIADAPANGLNREDFIKEFGYLLYSDKGAISGSYGLTPAEMKIINGALPQ